MKATSSVDKREIHIVGGGTFNHVRTHLSLAAPAFGSTARRLAELCATFWTAMDPQVHLTKLADPNSSITTNSDLAKLAEQLCLNNNVKVIFWTPAVCDFDAEVSGETKGREKRLNSASKEYTLKLKPANKIISMFRQQEIGGRAPRKDIFLVAFKTTAGVSEDEMYAAGLKLCKQVSANLVFVNDVITRTNMVVTPEEARYHVTHNRDEALKGLAEMAYLRSHLTFTRSTVIAGEPVGWESDEVYPSLRAVVNHCIEAGAYKPFLGVTAGHFAAKVSNNEFLTSRRKTNFNNLPSTGLVKVTTDGPDSVVARGGKPSVGGQSQRIVFAEHPETDCIVHFHCPIREGSAVPIVSQREFECGSHECGQNTSRGLQEFKTKSGYSIEAVFLDQHGPNIVFHHDVNPSEVIDFIEANFDLTAKTGGYVTS